MSESNKMSLRVFKRSEPVITLFWDLNELSEDQRKNVKILLMEKEHDGTGVVTKTVKELTFSLQDPKSFESSKNIGIAVIGHANNDISKDDSLLIKVIFGTKEIEEVFLRISPHGVLPYYERDQKSQNSHICFWDASKKRWGKLTLVKTSNGDFALPVVVVDDNRVCKCKKE